MRDPFKIEGPAVVQFSGGRSSGLMVARIVQAHGGTLPADVRVAFCNTGKELEPTLRFVRDCAERFGIEITWLEYADHKTPALRWRSVTFETASRNGEPFTALLDRKRYLPNSAQRLCTVNLKLETVKRWAEQELGFKYWDSALGLRADEPERLARARNPTEGPWENIMPLAVARITKADVAEFWRRQNFDLGLPSINNQTPHGNCDLCFLKSARLISALMREDPSRAAWWIEAEERPRSSKPGGGRFRNDRPSYRELLAAVQNQTPFDFGEADQLNDCICGT